MIRDDEVVRIRGQGKDGPFLPEADCPDPCNRSNGGVGMTFGTLVDMGEGDSRFLGEFAKKAGCAPWVERVPTFREF